MDIYRKELNQIYASQHLERENLNHTEVEQVNVKAELVASVTRGCTVITDAACDRCYIFGGDFGKLLGFFDKENQSAIESSSDEDRIYSLIHPEDLVDKRLLEYEFFKFVDSVDVEEKLNYKALCRIRMKDRTGQYVSVDNTTQIIRLSPNGKIWLILCSYNLSASEAVDSDINPTILNTVSGEAKHLTLSEIHTRILSFREKEILGLIRKGLPSKLIAEELKISIHTVNRHRQNIISKLSVSNSFEAIAAAEAMKIL